MRLVNETQEYNAFPQAANCNILNRCLFDWTWRSLIELGDTNESGAVIAEISKDLQHNRVCAGQDEDAAWHDPVQTATSSAEGETNIKAQEPSGEWGSGHLQVGYGDLAVINYSPKNTVHFAERAIRADFNIDAKTSLFTSSNVKLYRCGDGDINCSLSG